MSKYSLSKSERLKRQKDIDSLFASGTSLFKFPFRVIYQRLDTQTDNPVKFAVSVPKRKIKSAVTRNRIKRKIREYYRVNKHLLINAAQAHSCSINLMFIYANDDSSNCDNKEHILLELMEKIREQAFE